jgi:hypothetical protein
MLELVKVFWDIALLRRGPRDLPASRALLALIAALYLAVGVLQLRLVYPPRVALLHAVTDLAFTVASFWLCLAIGRRRYRVLQTLTAVLGTGVLLAPAAMLMFFVGLGFQPDAPATPALRHLLFVPVVVWEVAVLANIARRALEAPLVTGIAVASTYYLLGLVIESQLPAPGG